MSQKVGVELPTPLGDKVCCFCGLKEENDLEYGKIHEYDGIVTHYYCLLLSSNMQQRGQDEEGILGFLTEDINKELKRGKRLVCCYCKKSGATLGCCNTKCKRMFHFPCGLKAGSLHQFFGEFKSYCKSHRPTQKIDLRVSEEVKDLDTMICYICYDDVNPRDMLQTLWAPCCKKNAWFHRLCVQQLAISAGYFFKCPLCNNKTEFQKAMLDHGIFIPSQDASWELVPNAFEELLYRHNRCDAQNCLCPKGREHVSTNAKWELTLCRTCGSQGIHMACGRLKWVKPVWECSECTSILNKSVSSGTDDVTTKMLSYTIDKKSKRDDDLLSDDNSSDSDISVGGHTDTNLSVTDDLTSSESEDSSLKIHRPNDRQSNLEEDRSCAESSRRRSLARSMSPVKVDAPIYKTRKTPPTDDELPPVSKKPRISISVICEPTSANPSKATDSDDDIFVISGPSRNGIETATSERDGVKIPTNRSEKLFTGSQKAEEDKDVESRKSMDVRHNDKRKIKTPGSPSKISSETSMKTESNVVKRPSSGTPRPPPVEIDLSDGEIVVTENLATCETNGTVSQIDDTPELNIKISNVTSLPPEAFDLVPESINHQQVEALSNFRASTAGLTSQDPIILDEKLTSNETFNNNGPNLNSVYDLMKVVPFEGATNHPRLQANSVIYGLTIPGTNHTVPLIVSPPPNCKSKTPGIHSDPNNPLGIALCDCNSSRPSSFADVLNLAVFNGPLNNFAINSQPIQLIESPNITQKIDDLKGASSTAVSTKENVEKPVEPQSIDPKRWSVPLKSIIQEATVKTYSAAKPSKSSKRSTFIDNYVPFADRKDSSVASKHAITNPQAKTNVPNGIGYSAKTVPRTNTTISQKPSSKITQPNGAEPNNHKSSPAVQANGSPPNGLVSSIPSQAPTDPLSTKTFPQKSSVWAKVKGTYVPVDPPMPKIMSNWINKSTTNLGNSPSTQLHDQKTLSNGDKFPMYKCADSDKEDRNDSSNDCDGDAGSGPVDQPPTVDQANASPELPQTPGTNSNRFDGGIADGEHRTVDTPNKRRCDYQKDVTIQCFLTADRSDSCDRTGLIRKTINLRDIKFTIGGPNIVKMTLFETYNVNINVDTTSKCKYENSNNLTDSDNSTARWTNESSLISGKKTSRIADCDSADRIVSLTNDATLNQYESMSENDVEAPESTTTRSPIDANSGGQDELKENRDPIPPSTNSTNKTRMRSGVIDNSMKILNGKETTETICEKIDTRQNKVMDDDTPLVSDSSEIYSNGYKDQNDARPLIASMEIDESNSAATRSSITNTKNAEITEQLGTANKRRFSVKDGNSDETENSAKSKNYNSSKMYPMSGTVNADEALEQLSATKKRRKMSKDGNFNETHNNAKLNTTDGPENDNETKIKPVNENLSAVETLRQFGTDKERRKVKDSKKHNYTKLNSLVNDPTRSKRKWSETSHICQSDKFRVNNGLHNGETVQSGESLCCKVSIELTRIREVLATNMNLSEEKKILERNDEHFVNKMNGKNSMGKSKSLFKMTTKFLSRSRSCDNLPDRQERSRIVEFRRSKSVDKDNSLTLQYRHGAIGNNRRRRYKRNSRSFEKHDCVR